MSTHFTDYTEVVCRCDLCGFTVTQRLTAADDDDNYSPTLPDWGFVRLYLKPRESSVAKDLCPGCRKRLQSYLEESCTVR